MVPASRLSMRQCINVKLRARRALTRLTWTAVSERGYVADRFDVLDTVDPSGGMPAKSISRRGRSPIYEPHAMHDAMPWAAGLRSWLGCIYRSTGPTSATPGRLHHSLEHVGQASAPLTRARSSGDWP